MSHELRLTAEKIGKRISLIQPHLFERKRTIEPFRLSRLPRPDAELDEALGPEEELAWNSYWGGPDTHFVLRSAFSIPRGWSQPALHLPLGVAGDIFTHPEALLLIDGEPIGSADRYHHTIDLPPHLADGQRHEILLKGWTGLTGWPPDPTDRTKLFLKPCYVGEIDRDLQAFTTLAEVLLDVVGLLDDHRPAKNRLLTALDQAFLRLDTRDPLQTEFRHSVGRAMQVLQEGMESAGEPLDIRLHGIGHAHMDIAYLWPIAQIRQKNARTYANVLRLMDKFEAFTFSHSQPQLYAYTEEDFPQMFRRIKARIAEGRWEVLGGMWVEPDANMTGAEALVRQILLSRRYCEEKFGQAETPVLWLPDTFGFPACLPQLMVQAGLRWFVTNKLNWNQYNQMPASTTWWEGIDGSKVLAQFLTTPRDVQHLPFPTNYKSDLSAAEVIGTWTRNTEKSTIADLMICYGYGDGGGGPTDELIRKAEIYGDIPGVPRMSFGTVAKFFETIEMQADALPTWSGELYLEGHRGVLTSQGWIKQANRRSERLLQDAEWLEALAMAMGATPTDLTDAWRLLCLNQFHDILTGTSVTEVFDDARRDHETIQQTAAQVIERAVARIGASAPVGSTHVAVATTFGPSERFIVLPEGMQGVVRTDTGEALPTQQLPDGLLTAVPALANGGLVPLAPGPSSEHPDPFRIRQDGETLMIENGLLSVRFDKAGHIDRLWDLEQDRDVLAPGEKANKLQAFEDRPVSWDAWDIDIYFEDRGEVIGALTRQAVVEHGPLRVVVAQERVWRRSLITQRIILWRGSRRIDFETEVDWRETHILLKAAFPVAIRAVSATYDIQWGHVERPTHRNTSWDRAQFEVPAHKWVDLSEADYGVALLNDGKYGHDVRDDVLRLSLIKSATMPDPVADQGLHRFTYSLLPHPGGWRDMVPAEAYGLNAPLHLVPVTPGEGGSWDGVGPPAVSETPNAVIETIKPAETGDGVILRLYEAHRRRGPVALRLSPRVSGVARAGLLEDPGEPLEIVDGRVTLFLMPFEIITLRLELG